VIFQNDDDIEKSLKNSFSNKEDANRDLFDDTKSDNDSPWKFENPKVKTPFNLSLDAPLHRKIVWLKERLPNTSMQKICRSAVEKAADQLIAEVKRRQQL